MSKIALTVNFESISLKIPIDENCTISELMTEAATRYLKTTHTNQVVTVDKLQAKNGALLFSTDTIKDACCDDKTLYAQYSINGTKYYAPLPAHERVRDPNESINTTRSLNDSDVSKPTKPKKSRSNEIEWKDVTPENWPPRMPKEFKLDTIVTVPHLNLARIGGSQPDVREKPLLFRQETLNIMNSLTKWKNHEPSKRPGDLVKCQGVIVEGAPGQGKSCTTWAWLLSQLSTEPLLEQKQTTATCNDGSVSDSKSTIARASSILWVHLSGVNCYCIDMTATRVRQAHLNSDLDSKEIQILLTDATQDIVVLDGLVGNLKEHQKFASSLEFPKPGFHIQVASLAFQKGRSQRGIFEDEAGIKHLTMYPWTLDEYILACRDPVFFNSVAQFLTGDPTPRTYDDDERKEIIEAKFFHAGVSARWMFDRDTATIISKVKDMIESTSSIQSHHDLVIGVKTDNATNGLVVKHQYGVLFYVSEYVAISLAEFCSKETMEILYARAHKLRNRAVLGWLFEMEVIHSCKKQGSLNLFDQEGEPHVIECQKEQVCVNVTSDYFEPRIKHPRELRDKFMYNCNNPGFHLSKLDQLEGLNYHLHFFQITINPNHDFKMQHFVDHASWFVSHFQKSVKDFQIPKVSIWMIVPTKAKDSNHPLCETINLSNVTFASNKAQHEHKDGGFWINYEDQFKVYGFKPHDKYFELLFD